MHSQLWIVCEASAGTGRQLPVLPCNVKPPWPPWAFKPLAHLHAAIGRHQLVLKERVPQPQDGEVVEQVLVHNSELAWKRRAPGNGMGQASGQ